MKEMTIEEKIQINAALHDRVKFLKETIAELIKNGINTSYFEQCLSVCETLIEILPILNFSDKDIENFIIKYNIKLHPLYYNADGSLNIKKRLGCMGCPLASDNGLSDFKKYPLLVKAWIRNGLIWWNNHPNAACHKKYESIYELFVSNVFFKSVEETKLAIDGGFFGEKIDCKKFLEGYFNIKFE